MTLSRRAVLAGGAASAATSPGRPPTMRLTALATDGSVIDRLTLRRG